jgi:hypothetical protein
LEKLASRQRIQACDWFVEEKEIGLFGQNHRQCELSPLSTRELIRAAVKWNLDSLKP